MKTALVTGASSCNGHETVKCLLAAGYAVYAGARRLEPMEPLTEAGAHVLALDVTSTAVQTVLREAGRIDVLVNAAGYSSYGGLEEVPLAEARQQCDVNVFGPARLIQLILPTMRAQGFGRIVNVSSSGGKFGGPFGSCYHASKFAVEGLSDSLRMELHPFGIDVVLIEPGVIRTEGNAIAQAGLIKYSGEGPYRHGAMANAAVMAAADQGSIASPPSVVATTIVRAVRARNPLTRYASGGGAKAILMMRSLLSDRAFDAIMRIAARPRSASTGRWPSTPPT